MTSSRPHRVAVLCLEPLVGFDMSMVPQVLGAARDDQERSLYDVMVCGLQPGTVPTSRGYGIAVPHGPEVLARADTVIVPGTYHPASREGKSDDEVAAALGLVRPGTRMVSICTGAFVLAAAGLLEGRTATTHWEHVDLFGRLFPEVRLEPGVLFVDEGDVLTSAGLGAGIDLCLHLIRKDHGAEVANRAARACVVPPHREGGQAQFIQRPVPAESDTSTAATRAWAAENIATVLRVEQMVEHALMSERTFSRRFRAETGMSPQQWLLRTRLNRAMELLERSTLSVDRVAEEAGFGSAAALRHRMRQALGTSPQGYRRTFAGPGQALAAG